MNDSTRTIPLTQGKYAIVDAADYEWLSQWNWHAHHIGRHWYASRSTYPEGKRVTVHMHRVIIDAPDGLNVDHIDGDGLNNTRTNLRLATHRENLRNRRLNGNNTSGYKGVSWDKSTGKWRAQIRSGGKLRHLGLFEDKEEAARAFDETARELHGEFARLNFPKGA